MTCPTDLFYFRKKIDNDISARFENSRVKISRLVAQK